MPYNPAQPFVGAPGYFSSPAVRHSNDFLMLFSISESKRLNSALWNRQESLSASSRFYTDFDCLDKTLFLTLHRRFQNQDGRQHSLERRTPSGLHCRMYVVFLLPAKRSFPDASAKFSDPIKLSAWYPPLRDFEPVAFTRRDFSRYAVVNIAQSDHFSDTPDRLSRKVLLPPPFRSRSIQDLSSASWRIIGGPYWCRSRKVTIFLTLLTKSRRNISISSPSRS